MSAEGAIQDLPDSKGSATAPLRRRWFLILPSALLVAIGLLFLLHALWMQRIERKMGTLLDAWRDLGLPANTTELEAWSKRPVEGVNAADIYDEAFASMIKPGDRWEAVSAFQRGDTDATEGDTALTARAYLAENAPALDLLRKAAAVRAYGRPVEVDGLQTGSVSSVQDALAAARLLSVDAARAIMDGDHLIFEADIRAVFRMAQVLGTEPTVMSQLVAIACEAIAVENVRIALEQRDVPRDCALSLAAMLKESNDHPARMATGLIGDVCLHENMFGEGLPELFCYVSPLDSRYGWVDRVAQIPYTLAGIRDLDRLRHLEVQMALYHALHADLQEILAELQAVEHKIADTSPLLVVTYGLADGMTHAGYQAIKMLASVRCARLALLVHAYELDHGALPATLDQLVPNYLEAAPLDPYTHANLHYRGEEGGYVVYSVGRNAGDDGGVAKRPGSSGPEDDIMFRVVR